METVLLLKLIEEQLEELQVKNLLCLNVASLTTITDNIFICTGRSHRHVKSIAQNLIEKLKKNSISPLNITGMNNGEWVLVDCGDIVVHIMLADIRAFYNLEGLWTVEHNTSCHEINEH